MTRHDFLRGTASLAAFAVSVDGAAALSPSWGVFHGFQCVEETPRPLTAVNLRRAIAAMKANALPAIPIDGTDYYPGALHSTPWPAVSA